VTFSLRHLRVSLAWWPAGNSHYTWTSLWGVFQTLTLLGRGVPFSGRSPGRGI